MRTSKTPKKSTSKRTGLANVDDGLYGLGPYSREVLGRAGLKTRATLEKAGPVGAFLAAKAVEPRVSLNLLWGIAGALSDTHWSKLSPAYRASLMLEYDAYCDLNPQHRAPSNNARRRQRKK